MSPPDVFLLTNVDGDEVSLTAEEFFAVNCDFEPEVTDEVRSLAVGQSYSDGGGSQPVWTIRRVS